jgi:hypothetical protein
MCITLTAMVVSILTRVWNKFHNIFKCSLLGPWQETGRNREKLLLPYNVPWNGPETSWGH